MVKSSQQTPTAPINRIAPYLEDSGGVGSSRQAGRAKQASTNKPQEASTNTSTEQMQSFAGFMDAIAAFSFIGNLRNAFHSPFASMGQFAMMAPFFANLFGGYGSANPAQQRQVPPQYRGQPDMADTITGTVAEAKQGVVDAKAHKRKVEQDLRSAAKMAGYEISDKKAERSKLSKQEQAKRDREFRAAIEDATAAHAKSRIEYRTAKAGNKDVSDEELTAHQNKMHRDQIALVTLKQARDDGTSLSEARKTIRGIHSRMDTIDASLTEINSAAEASQSTRSWGEFFASWGSKKDQTKSEQQFNLPQAHANLAKAYEGIEGVLGSGNPDIRQVVEQNANYALARAIHAEASDYNLAL